MAERIFRWIYGGWFLFWGASSLTMRLFGVGVAPPQSEGAAQTLMDSVNASFMGPVSGICFVVAGALLWRRTTTPMGIAILAPFVTYILLFHTTLEGSNPIWGAAWFAGWVVLAWLYRDAFRPLLNYKD